jgi:lipoprotein-anchoring transpeptidase ErfK/SrfK
MPRLGAARESSQVGGRTSDGVVRPARAVRTNVKGQMVSRLRGSAIGTVATIAAVLGLGAAAFAAGVRPELATLTAGPSVEAAEVDTAAAAPTGWTDWAPEPSAAAASSVAGGRGTVNGQAPIAAASPRSKQASSAQQVACGPGVRQREVEIALSTLAEYGPVVVDGRQSATDCEAIMRFQRRFGLRPVNGTADGQTASVAERIVASLSEARRAECRAGPRLTACIDLTLQTVWVVRDGEMVLGPTVTRTGFRGYATPVGTFTIDRRALREWSNPYEVWLPYWQHFIDGIGFHQTTTYLDNAALGSHGCINLLPDDAVKMWHLLRVGSTVRTFGHRAGT